MRLRPWRDNWKKGKKGKAGNIRRGHSQGNLTDRVSKYKKRRSTLQTPISRISRASLKSEMIDQLKK